MEVVILLGKIRQGKSCLRNAKIMDTSHSLIEKQKP